MMIAEKTIDILEAVLNHADDIDLEKLADITGMSPRTVRRFVAMLIRRGYLYQKGKGEKYSLGIKLMQFCNVNNFITNIKEQTYPFLKKLSDETSETVFIASQNGYEAVKICSVTPKQILMINPDLGQIMSNPLHCTCDGKVFLAHMSENAIENMDLKIYTNNTITDKVKLRNEINNIRYTNVAFDDEEFVNGVTGVAVPVKGEDGNVIAAVALISPTTRTSSAKIRQLAPIVTNRALEMSLALGYRSP